MMRPSELQKGIKNLRDFLKKVAKKMPDKENRGFIDHMVYLNNVLDETEKAFQYLDNLQLDYLKKQRKQK